VRIPTKIIAYKNIMKILHIEEGNSQSSQVPILTGNRQKSPRNKRTRKEELKKNKNKIRIKKNILIDYHKKKIIDYDSFSQLRFV